MLLLQYDNLLLKSILTERLLDSEEDGSPSSINQVVSDFDNVTFHISTPDKEDKNKLLVSIYIKSYKDLVKYGAEQVLDREYGAYKYDPPEQGYNYSLLIDPAKLPQDLEKRQELVNNIALFKRNTLAAPFERAFDIFEELSKDAEKNSLDLYRVPEDSPAAEVMAIHYREEESIYVKPSHDRVTVIFSTIFRDETDQVFGKVFLQEFVDARKRSVQNAPQVLFSKEPPLEIRSVVKVPSKQATVGGLDSVGYVTFVLFPRHIARRESCISHIQTFRDYFHYHIKCSKAYMHSRMRYRVSEFLKVLNRAKPEAAERERKTASGRRFIST